ncbi:uncharacterized protein [Haliotis asinina]|uniref:uncharacterized protein n=1 Tax=Haliotis asinina TaxID=109174 RepID=UPI0035318BC2
MLLTWSRSLGAVIVLLSQAILCLSGCHYNCRECLDDQCLSCRRYFWGRDAQDQLDCHASCLSTCDTTCDKDTGECLPSYNNNNRRVMYIKCHDNGTCIECPRNCKCRGGQCVSCKGYHYGPGTMCVEECSSKCVRKRCDKVTGSCRHGCYLGWYGSLCDQACPGDCSRCHRETGLCPTTTTITTTTWSEENEDEGIGLSGKLTVFAGVFIFVLVGMCAYKWWKKQNTPSEYSDEDCSDFEMQTHLHNSHERVPSAPESNSRTYIVDADTPLFNTGRGEELEQGENEAIPQHSTPPQTVSQEPPPYPVSAHQPNQEAPQPPYWEPADSPAHPAPSAPRPPPPAYSSLFPDTTSEH